MCLLCYVQAKPTVVAEMQLFSFIHTKVSLFCHCRTSGKKKRNKNEKLLQQKRMRPVQQFDCWCHVTLHLTVAIALHYSSQSCGGSVFQHSRGKHAQQKTVFTRDTQHFSRAEKQLITAKFEFQDLQFYVDAFQGNSLTWSCLAFQSAS